MSEKYDTSGAVATVGMYCSVVGFPKYFKLGGLNPTCCFYGIAALPVNEFDNNGSYPDKIFGVCWAIVGLCSSLDTSSCKLTTKGCFVGFLFKLLIGFIKSSTPLALILFSYV